MKTINSEIRLHTAMIDRTPIAVFIGNELVGSGQIAGIAQDSVKIGDERYLREVCTFKYAG